MKKFTIRQNVIDEEIRRLVKDMEEMDACSENYQRMAESLERLCKARSYKKENLVDPNALMAIFGNLGGILLILNYEQLNVITTKALSFVMKSPKI